MVVSAVAGAIFEVSVEVIVEVESFVTSVLLVEPPLQAAKNAQTERAIRTFFILINLDFYNYFKFIPLF